MTRLEEETGRGGGEGREGRKGRSRASRKGDGLLFLVLMLMLMTMTMLMLILMLFLTEAEVVEERFGGNDEIERLRRRGGRVVAGKGDFAARAESERHLQV